MFKDIVFGISVALVALVAPVAIFVTLCASYFASSFVNARDFKQYMNVRRIEYTNYQQLDDEIHSAVFPKISGDKPRLVKCISGGNICIFLEDVK